MTLGRLRLIIVLVAWYLGSAGAIAPLATATGPDCTDHPTLATPSPVASTTPADDRGVLTDVVIPPVGPADEFAIVLHPPDRSGSIATIDGRPWIDFNGGVNPLAMVGAQVVETPLTRADLSKLRDLLALWTACDEAGTIRGGAGLFSEFGGDLLAGAGNDGCWDADSPGVLRGDVPFGRSEFPLSLMSAGVLPDGHVFAVVLQEPDMYFRGGLNPSSLWIIRPEVEGWTVDAIVGNLVSLYLSEFEPGDGGFVEPGLDAGPATPTT